MYKKSQKMRDFGGILRGVDGVFCTGIGAGRQLSVVSGQWSVVSGQWSVVSGQGSGAGGSRAVWEVDLPCPVEAYRFWNPFDPRNKSPKRRVGELVLSHFGRMGHTVGPRNLFHPRCPKARHLGHPASGVVDRLSQDFVLGLRLGLHPGLTSFAPYGRSCRGQRLIPRGVQEKHPSGAKAHVSIEAFVARINPCPFKTIWSRSILSFASPLRGWGARLA
jgi:hypothetical protein